MENILAQAVSFAPWVSRADGMVIITVEGGGWPKALRNGSTKELEVHLHLQRWVRDGPLRRNFTIKFTWYRDGRMLRTRDLGISLKANKTRRMDWRCRDPFTGRVSTLHAVAARIKEQRYGVHDMDGLWGDHNNRWGGWSTLDWSKLRTIHANTDEDAV